ncbi:hypothetical protein [Candidatus Thiosymbion oneisti]|uniref:hypothetical protein n=1 Tax=Candidatus Thiosymbion oneisti TaxID=589554 RepID=UPI00105C71BE|nr:hypothetical protein [Candidatus Thiosymbion oneisti]
MKKPYVGLLAGVLAFGMGAVPLDPLVTDVEAKRFGGGFGRSSFRSGKGGRFKPFSISSSSKARRTGKPKRGIKTERPRGTGKPKGNIRTEKPKGTGKPKGNIRTENPRGTGKPKGSIKTGGRKGRIATSGQSVRTKAAINAKRMRDKFKKKPSPVVSGRAGKAPTIGGQRHATIDKTYGDNPIYRRARKTDRGSYWKRREQFYGRNYEPPAYVYNMASSYGLFGTIFLAGLLNNVSNAGAFAHHHQNDPGYQAWRREADELAKQNEDLRNKLVAMDAEAAKLDGTPVDPAYLPKGVDPDIVLASGVRAATLPQLRVCVGSQSGAYYRVTEQGLGLSLGDTVNVVPVETVGSNQALEFLVDGKCDSAWIQRDSYWNYIEATKTNNLPFVRVVSPYKEAVHLICHASGPSKISRLTEDHKVWFPKKSGAAETWKNFIGEDAGYGEVQTVLNTPSMAVASNKEALLKVTDAKSCMMYVAAPGETGFMKVVEEMAVTRNLVMIDVSDGDLENTTDPAGEDVYEYKEIDSSVYPSLARQNGVVFGSGDIDTLYVRADFVIANAWKDANPELYPSLAFDIASLEDEIRTVVGQ